MTICAVAAVYRYDGICRHNILRVFCPRDDDGLTSPRRRGFIMNILITRVNNLYTFYFYGPREVIFYIVIYYIIKSNVNTHALCVANPFGPLKNRGNFPTVVRRFYLFIAYFSSSFFRFNFKFNVKKLSI